MGNILIILLVLALVIHVSSLTLSIRRLSTERLSKLIDGYNHKQIVDIVEYNKKVYTMNIVVMTLKYTIALVIIIFSVINRTYDFFLSSWSNQIAEYLTFIILSAPFVLLFLFKKYYIDVILGILFGLTKRSKSRKTLMFSIEMIFGYSIFLVTAGIFILSNILGVILLLVISIGCLIIFVIRQLSGDKLKNEKLLIKLKTFSKNHNHKFNGIMVRLASKHNNKGIAYYNGINKQIYFNPSLLSNLTDNELLAIYGHEVAHSINKDTRLGFKEFISFVFIALLFVLGISLVNIEPSVNNNVLQIFIIYFLYLPFKELFKFVFNYFSRKQEFGADNFAAQNVKPEHLVSALLKVHYLNLKNPIPHGLDTAINYRHPSLLDRLRAINKVNPK